MGGFSSHPWYQARLALDPIPGAVGVCEYCRTRRHYGWCDEMALEWERAVITGRGRPVPAYRMGPSCAAPPPRVPPRDPDFLDRIEKMAARDNVTLRRL